MNDQRAHFLTMVGDIFLAAAAGDLIVSVRLRDERTVTGIPTARLARGENGDEVDDTGYSQELHVDGTDLNLEDVVACTVCDPDA